MSKKIIIRGFLVSLMFSIQTSLFASAGTDSAAFLQIPVGAGPAAMGSAYSALATDAYAPVWNPGGLGFLDSVQLAGQHVSYLESINYEFLSAVFPLRAGDSVGVSVQHLGSGDIEAIDKTGVSQGTYSDTFGAYSVAYGHALTDRLSLGVTGKLIRMKLSDVSASAFAGDFGTLWRVNDHFNVSGVLANLGSSVKFLQESDPLPLTARLGAAFSPSRFWIFSGELGVPRTGLVNGRFGAEWRAFNFMALRVGYRTETTKELSALAGLTTGFGILVWGHELAYAWLPYGDLGNSQYVSLVLRFGAPEKRNLIQYQHTKFESQDLSTYFSGPEGNEFDNERVNERYRKKSNQAVQGTPSGVTK